jgi:hypothetical protein
MGSILFYVLHERDFSKDKYFYNNRKVRFFYRCPETLQLPQDVPANAGFLCDYAAVFDAATNETPCIITHNSRSLMSTLKGRVQVCTAAVLLKCSVHTAQYSNREHTQQTSRHICL